MLVGFCTGANLFSLLGTGAFFSWMLSSVWVVNPRELTAQGRRKKNTGPYIKGLHHEAFRKIVARAGTAAGIEIPCHPHMYRAVAREVQGLLERLS